MRIFQKGEDMVVEGLSHFQLSEIFDCGQCFRFSQREDGVWQGVAFGRFLQIRQDLEKIVFLETDRETFETVWRDYFDLNRDYAQIAKLFSQYEILDNARRYAQGIRILRQQPFEALCSFILSQNNHIPRIRGMIARLCESFGEEIAPGQFAFPTPQRLAGLEREDLTPIRAGFRDRYLLSAARMVAEGKLDLEEVGRLELPLAREQLKRICGVGDKVAECALLFGWHRMEAFPVDVWMKRVMERLLPEGLPDDVLSLAGIAQQYLFHYARSLGIGKEKEGDGLRVG